MKIQIKLDANNDSSWRLNKEQLYVKEKYAQTGKRIGKQAAVFDKATPGQGSGLDCRLLGKTN